MSRLRHRRLAAQIRKHEAMICEAKAGPETAARLGVPVGTVFDARVVVMKRSRWPFMDSIRARLVYKLRRDVITPRMAASLKQEM